MPTRLAAPVLTVDANKMHKIDVRNVENLFGMWTGEYTLKDHSLTLLICDASLFKMCRVYGGGPPIRKSELEVVESRNILLRIKTTVYTARTHRDEQVQ